MWGSHRQKWMFAAGAVLVVVVLVAWLLSSSGAPQIPQGLDARSRHVGQSLVAGDQAVFEQLAAADTDQQKTEWYEAARSILPDVFHDQRIVIDYTAETKFAKEEEGEACVLVTAIPADLDLARELAPDASNPEAKLLLYWKHNGAGEWVMDSPKCLKSIRMDRSHDWTGRAGDRKNFQQANQ